MTLLQLNENLFKIITWSREIFQACSFLTENEISKELDFESIIDEFACIKANFLFPQASTWHWIGVWTKNLKRMKGEI